MTTTPEMLFDIAEEQQPPSAIYYVRTPGAAPKGKQALAVGALVDVAPSGFARRPTWRGRITAHMYSTSDNTYTGLSLVDCTDPGDFPHYQIIGRGYQVEASHTSPVDDGGSR